jgi:hypothetical protein
VYWQDAPPPPPPSTWHFQNLGSEIIGDPTLSSAGQGRLNIYARGLDNNLWYKYANGGPWSAWQNVSAATGSGPIASGPGAVSWNSVRVDVVARMANNTVGHWYFDGAWHYDNLGGNITGDPDIASTGEGHLNVFARGATGDLEQKWFVNGSWSGWQDLSALTGSGAIGGGPGAVATSSNTVDVVARMPNSTVGRYYWSGSAWTYESLGPEQILGDPDASSVGGGAVNYYAEGLDGNLWQKWRIGSGWSAWQNLSALTGSGTIGSGPGAVSWDTQRVDVVARMPNGNVGNWWYGP